MEARRNIHRSDHSTRSNYEDSFVSDEDISWRLKNTQLFTSSSESESSKQDYYALRYPALAKLEETCREIELENKAKADLMESKVNITVNTTDTSYYSIPCAYKANEESLTSRSFEKINSLLNKNINDTVTTASSYADAMGCPNDPHDSWRHQDSLDANSSLLEIKEVLHQLGNVQVKSRDSNSNSAGLNLYFDRLTKSFEKLPSDFKEQLRTILEETQLVDNDDSVTAFRDLVLKIIGKTRDLQDETIPFTIDQSIFKGSFQESPINSPSVDLNAEETLVKTPLNNTQNKKVYRKTPVDLVKSSAFASTPLRIAALTRCMDTPRSDTQSPKSPWPERDLNESSFTYNERICLGDNVPKIAKPMPELTEEKIKLLEEARRQEMVLAAESPYSSKNECKNESREFEDSSSQIMSSPDSLVTRGRVSNNLYDSLDDWDIEKELAERDKRLAETEKTIKNIVEDKTAGSYSSELLNVVNTYFDVSNSDRLKSSDGLSDSGVETARGSKRTDKLSDSDSSLDSRMGNVTLRKLSTSSVKKSSKSKCSQSPVTTSSRYRSATPRAGSVRNKSPTVLSSKSKVPISPKLTPRVLKKTTSAPVTPRVVSARKNIASKFTPSKVSSALSTISSKSASKTSSKAFKVPLKPPMITITPSTPMSSDTNFSTFKSPAPVQYAGKYFCTPTKAQPKQKKIFFPTPVKKDTPQESKSDLLLKKMYPSSAEVRSPVADYIRGGRDAVTIKTIPKLQNEYLLSKEEMLNYEPKKVNKENNPPNFEFNIPSAVYQSKKQVQEFDARPTIPQGSRVQKLVAKKDSRAVIKHPGTSIIPNTDLQNTSIRIKTVAEKRTAINSRTRAQIFATK